MCEKCGGRGLIITGPDSAIPCNCMKILAQKNRLKTAGIPGKKVLLKDFSCAYYSDKLRVGQTGKTYYESAEDAIVAAQQFIKKPEDGIALVGPPGRGKTYLSRCTAYEMVERGMDVIFVVVPDLLAEIKSTYNSESKDTELSIIEAARTVKVLFLDDLGAHNYSDWVLNQLYSILNYRSNNKMPTFITSNLDIEQMSVKLGDRITSRILDLCAIHFMSSENDVRALKRQQKARAV